MSDVNFGIPDPAAQVAALPAVVGAYEEGLQTLANAALLPVANHITGSEAMLGSIYQTLRRSMNGKIQAANRQLAPISQALGAYLAGQVGHYGAALDSLGQSAPPPPGPACNVPHVTEIPPGYVPVKYIEPGGLDCCPAGSVAVNYSPTGAYWCWAPAPGIPPSPPPPAPPQPCPPGAQCTEILPSPPPPAPPPPPPISPPPSPPPETCPPGGPCPPVTDHKPTCPTCVPSKITLGDKIAADITCNIPPFDIPTPGSPEWCAAVPKWLDLMEQAGNQIYTVVTTPLELIDAALSAYRDAKVDADSNVISRAIMTIPVLVMNAVGSTLEPLIHALRYAVCAITKGLPAPEGTGRGRFIGLTIFTVSWHILRDAEVGWELGLRFTFHMGDAIPLMDDLLHRLHSWMYQAEIPSAAEARAAFLRGKLPDRMYECWLKANGVNAEVSDPVLQAERETLSTREWIEWGRRNNLDRGHIAAMLRWIGWTDENETSAIQDLYDELPTIADHLHWLTRNVDDAGYVQKYGLLDGFAPDGEIQQLGPWPTYQTTTDVHGRNFWGAFGHDLRSRGMQQLYAAYHYAAHWVQPSPEQLKRFLWRSADIQAATGKPFQLEDVKRILAEQDYAPQAINWFAATAYEIPAISYIKEWYRQGIITPDQLKVYHQKLGYDPKDAENFVAIDDLQKRRMRASSSHGWTTAAIAKAWTADQITTDEARARYLYLGYTEDEFQAMLRRAVADFNYTVFTRARTRALTRQAMAIQQSQMIGTIDRPQASQLLQSLGYPATFADAVATANESAAATKAAAEAVRSIRKRFLSGDLAAEEAANMLGAAGIVPAAQQRYITLWQLEFTPRRKSLAAGEVIKDLSQGLLGRADAITRLHNLGYPDPDVMVMLADADQRAARIAAQIAAAQGRAAAAAERELEKAAREAERARRFALRELERVAPVPKLQKWAKLGLVGKDEFADRLTLYGYPPQAIEAFYAEACNGKGAACVETTPKGPTQGLGEVGPVGEGP